MEVHLRKITRCLGKAIDQLEKVSTSEKAANEVSFRLNLGLLRIPLSITPKSSHNTVVSVKAGRTPSRSEVHVTQHQVHLFVWFLLDMYPGQDRTLQRRNRP